MWPGARMLSFEPGLGLLRCHRSAEFHESTGSTDNGSGKLQGQELKSHLSCPNPPFFLLAIPLLHLSLRLQLRLQLRLRQRRQFQRRRHMYPLYPLHVVTSTVPRGYWCYDKCFSSLIPFVPLVANQLRVGGNA